MIDTSYYKAHLYSRVTAAFVGVLDADGKMNNSSWGPKQRRLGHLGFEAVLWNRHCVWQVAKIVMGQACVDDSY